MNWLHSERLASYLKSDRQWFRSQRLAHAMRMKRIETDPEEKAFWQSVINANKWRTFRDQPKTT